MTVYKVSGRGYGCNSYILTADNRTAVIIDCADEKVYYRCEELGLKPIAVLLTHGHFDHVGGCGKFNSENVPICCGEREEKFIFSKENRTIFGGVYIPDFNIFKTFADGEKITVGGIKLEVISTPGHTAGSVCYLADECLFSGDTLFLGSIGRSDLPGGDFIQLMGSLKKLLSIDKNLKVYCGHGSETMLNFERKNNPYVKY